MTDQIYIPQEMTIQMAAKLRGCSRNRFKTGYVAPGLCPLTHVPGRKRPVILKSDFDQIDAKLKAWNNARAAAELRKRRHTTNFDKIFQMTFGSGT